MRRYFRHIIGPIAFVLIIAGAVRFVTSVEFGKLTLSVLEHAVGFRIEYGSMRGNILQGFRIEDYYVRLTERDSICGAAAEFYYRFNPLMLQLPNRFEINLIEPRVLLTARPKEERAERPAPAPGLPNIRLSLRMSVKNGQVTYRGDQTFHADAISGLVFADFIGSRMHFLTRDLTVRSEEHALLVRSVNLDADIDDDRIRVNSLRLDGEGVSLEGRGSYAYEPARAVFDFDEARIGLERVGLPRSEAQFAGTVVYADGALQPLVRGSITGLGPFAEFTFETKASGDTIRVAVTDAGVYGGSIAGQLTLVRLKHVAFDGDFSDVDAGALLGMNAAVPASGHFTYDDGAFAGTIRSLAGPDLGFDSVLCYGRYAVGDLRLDSLFVFEGGPTMRVQGTVLPLVDLYLDFDDFDFGRFEPYAPVRGRLSGSARIVGTPEDLLGLTLSSRLQFTALAIRGIGADTVVIRSEGFQRDGTRRELSVAVAGLALGDRRVESVALTVRDTTFTLVAVDNVDTIFAAGTVYGGLRGVVDSLIVNYNRVLTRNTEPIDFNILAGTVGRINLALADGVFEFSGEPLRLRLEAIDLHRLGRLFGLRQDLRGMLDLDLARDSLRISARAVDFMGMKNGTLFLVGRRREGGIVIDSLHVIDDLGQEVDARGVLAWENSDVRARFRNVGVWVLAFLEKFLVEPSGLMTGEVGFKGNIDRFEFTGGGTIHEGSFIVPIIASRFDSVKTTVVFEGGRILFTSGRGIISPANGRKMPGAWIDGGGVVKLEKRFSVNNLNFDFSFVDAPVQFPPFAFGVGSGNFSLNMRDRVMHYKGSIAVQEAVIPLEFGMKIEEEQAASDDAWRLNLSLRAERDVWLRNRDADIEFGGDLSIVRETGPVHLSGVLESGRGNYYWINHVLSITEGKVTFVPADEIDPEVDFWGEMDTREGVKIILHMFGPISEPIFEFFTDPPGSYTEQDIITYLNLNITWQELEQLKRGEYMSRIVPRSLLSWLEGDVSRAVRQYTGLDYFRIETPFFETDEKTRLTVGKFISRNLFVTYTYDITTFSNEFNVEYYIDDKNKIHVERDEGGEYSVQYQYRLRF